jgi:NAD(P)-dependent dehydrogenase (short-subunit alcohol dehydrogenase family)
LPTVSQLDVRNQDSVDHYIYENGPFDFTVYSAGIQHLSFISDLDIDVVNEMFDVNVYGFLRVMKSLGAQQKSGRVCAVVSNAANTPMRGSISYCASKAALGMAIKVAAREMAPNWIITGIAPGPVEDTPMTRSVDRQVMQLREWTEQHMREYESSLIPMSRRSSPVEVASAIMMMLLGSEMLTGQVLSMTGGRT